MHRIGCLSVGRGVGDTEESVYLHLPEFGYLAQKLLPLAGDLLGSGNRDLLFPFWRRLQPELFVLYLERFGWG